MFSFLWRRREPTLEDRLHDLFREPIDDTQLRQRVEFFARQDWPFRRLTPVWGPPLYRRQRVMFRPFILRHFNHWGVRWRGKYEEALEQWLAEVDRLDDVELFKLLYRWKLTSLSSSRAHQQVLADLMGRYRWAASTAERQRLLDKYLAGWQIPEDIAVEVYAIDPEAAQPFLLAHLWAVPGARLAEEARKRGDEELLFALYRRDVKHQQWLKDIRKVAEETPSSADLVRALRQRHPQQFQGLGEGLYQVVLLRGRDAFPYVLPHLRFIWSDRFAPWYGKLLGLALQRGWLDLWAALVRCRGAAAFNEAVAGLLADRSLPEGEVVRRLLLLPGGPGEGGFQAALPLAERTALALYERFPGLARGAFKVSLGGAWWGCPQLLATVLRADDEALIDYLASQAILAGGLNAPIREIVGKLSRYYEDLLARDPAEFARRAVAVLGQVPAYTIGRRYDNLIRNNRLARLLFERSAGAHSHDPRLVRDLLEAPEIHVQMLAFRALGRDEANARAIAAENLDLLLPTLLRPLHRSTRLFAFGAVANAANTEGNARRVLEKAREALDLPDKHYPKEALIGLIGRVLARWPALRGPNEQPIVHSREAS
jgi:hypothetical protein